jgi:hypothetical protein
MRHRLRGLPPALLALGALAAATAHAEPPPPSAPGFAKRASSVVSVERLLAVTSQKSKYGDSSASISTVGMGATSAGRLGYSWIAESGLTLGSVLGFAYQSVPGSHVAIGTVGPRVGFAGSRDRMGFWVRTGPSLLAGRDARDATLWCAAWGLDAYAVVTPLRHFGILIGVDAEIPFAGRASGSGSSGSFRYTSIGLGAGALVDF